MPTQSPGLRHLRVAVIVWRALVREVDRSAAISSAIAERRAAAAEQRSEFGPPRW